MANKAMNQFLERSIVKLLINNEKELTMNFVKGYNCWRKRLVAHYRFRIVMENKRS